MSKPSAGELADKIAKIDRALKRSENDNGYEAFVYLRKIWPTLRAAALHHADPITTEQLDQLQFRKVLHERPAPPANEGMREAIIEECAKKAESMTGHVRSPITKEVAQAIRALALAQEPKP